MAYASQAGYLLETHNQSAYLEDMVEVIEGVTAGCYQTRPGPVISVIGGMATEAGRMAAIGKLVLPLTTHCGHPHFQKADIQR